MKITPEIQIKIKELIDKGEKQLNIAKQFGISQCAVRYYSSDDKRKEIINYNTNWFKNLPQERKKKYYKSRKKSILAYLNNKYKTNEEFREKTKKLNKIYKLRQKNKKEFK